MKRLAPAALAVLLAACAGAPTKTPPPPASANPPSANTTDRSPRSPYAPAQEDPNKRGDYTAGGLYAPHIADGAPDDLPDVDAIPEPQVKAEPRSRYGNRAYSVLGKHYQVLDRAEGYVEQGMASYYGKKFHGRRTSILEVYDMYAFSAAHKTLPLPCYARVTNLANGKSVVVRINDRGPFHAGRIIDLSYAAAVKLGVHRSGVAKVEVRALGVDERDADTRVASATPAPTGESALDRVVAALPVATANASERVPDTTEVKPAPAGPWRFDMRQDGKTMTADEFEAWMKSRQVRVATGKAGAAPEVREAQPAPSPVAPEQKPAPASAPAKSQGGAVTLQIASFAARGNAERALAMLEDAGIRDARLLDADAAGQKVWRLRVGPVTPDAVAELRARVAGLGFGPPNVIRD
ncbi:septal ring lytic transglycosylase RlpA family protein [Lysobacter sp. CFH 32150]|uniref:septal ring lytic transglycosylase RlpA family protein n=1 Tax=Lysobacter sp. CFH 32150 TaxID=2927128 RepID=UPI001FA6D104|nr:septal ring lytic transglycosylase RlpA family protein [Lysobacter sp. CFH 32150]MCI4568198.1 septal ring lytic transglycosylase RlpA family protein [Lysobacter sp. CFH 32150]